MKRFLLAQPIWQAAAGAAVGMMILSTAPEAMAQQVRQVCEQFACYRYGDSGPAVADIQRALRIPVDGFYGVQTENAVRYYQRENQLTYVDGIAGPETLTLLGLDFLAAGGGATYPASPSFPGEGGYLGGDPSVSLAAASPTYPYVVAIPGRDAVLLRQVQRYFPNAFVASSRRGAFIQAGAFQQRSFAETRSSYLRNQGFDARVAYKP